ncbi:hypothetical protein J6590_028003 [Homalodisca vitripennis]|nr:hypothetical protein J6590_028003 [Homalodisca vitripennis]
MEKVLTAIYKKFCPGSLKNCVKVFTNVYVQVIVVFSAMEIVFITILLHGYFYTTNIKVYTSINCIELLLLWYVQVVFHFPNRQRLQLPNKFCPGHDYTFDYGV